MDMAANGNKKQEILARYRQAAGQLPKSYLSWELYGAGIEKLGRQGQPGKIPLRPPQPEEVLLRVDAVGLCFSDTKLIWAGAEHPRIRGRDLQKDPTVPGHEAALTVVEVGANWRGRFARGQRFIIQADIFIQGEQKAFGYVQRGALAQYVYAGPWVLAGDAGCYLLPLQEKTGYAEAALVEPWACVEAAYHIACRQRPVPRGRLLVVFAGAKAADFTGMYADGEEPAFTAVLGETEMDLTPILGDAGAVKRAEPSAAAVEALRLEAGGEGFDDIFIIGQASPEI
ncbi:MAG: alcohol dehydrogenase catalytic domain-containing protein, partial [Planctomycetota bacterium]|nr:alcohol dehydrogenase catalytic domain-containing protein [Planctomycetota bacterium]